MRRMGSVIPQQTNIETGDVEIPQVEIPDTPVSEWRSLVATLIGRPVTAAEQSLIDRAANHNWTARATADSVREGRI